MERAQVLKVVVVGPSDVQRECASVKSIADDLNETMRHGRIPAALQVLHWKTDSRPGAHILGPQGRIDEDLDIDDCDVLIGVFWRRFGTPVHDAESGTEHEIRRATKLWEERRRPEVMLYFNQAPDNAATGDSAEQLEKLERFKKELISGKTLLIGTYNGLDEFRETLFNNLLKLSVQLIRPSDAMTLTVKTVPVVIRAEGITELVDDIVLECSTGLASRPIEPSEALTILLFFTNPVTSRIIADTRAPVRPPETEAILYEVGTLRERVQVRGSLIGPNCLMFGPFKVTAPGPTRVRIYHISNLRVNATTAPMSVNDTSVQMLVQAVGARVEVSSHTIAFIRRGLLFEIRDAKSGGPLRTQDHLLRADDGRQPLRIATVRFSELFSHAFKPRIDWLFAIGLGSERVLPAESPPLLAAYGEVGRKARYLGLANFGTQVWAIFANIPAGLRFFVSTRSTGLAARLCRRGAENDSLDLPEIWEVPLTRCLLPGGHESRTGGVTWEINRTSGDSSPTFAEFGVFVSSDYDFAIDLPTLPPVFVCGGFAPTPMSGTFDLASGGLAGGFDIPVPRFVDSPLAHTILTARARTK